MKIFVTFLAVSLLSLSVGIAQNKEYSFKEKYRVTLPAQLRVSSSDGNIEVVPSDGDEIEVFYIVKRNVTLLRVNKEDLDKELILNVVHSGNSLEITVKYKDEKWIGNDWNRMNIHFEIHTPKQTAVNLHTSDGNISITGLTGDQKCKTSDGHIDVTGVTGNITGNTSDGHVVINEIKGTVNVSTSDGNIKLNNIAGDVESSTSDGNIDIVSITGNITAKTSDGYITFKEVSGSFTGITSDGNIKGNLLKLNKGLSAKTGDGNIDITIPDKLGLDLDIKGESLHVPLDNFSGRSDEKYIQGKSNGGGIPVNLSTSDGNIRLTYR